MIFIFIFTPQKNQGEVIFLIMTRGIIKNKQIIICEFQKQRPAWNEQKLKQKTLFCSLSLE